LAIFEPTLHFRKESVPKIISSRYSRGLEGFFDLVALASPQGVEASEIGRRPKPSQLRALSLTCEGSGSRFEISKYQRHPTGAVDVPSTSVDPTSTRLLHLVGGALPPPRFAHEWRGAWSRTRLAHPSTPSFTIAYVPELDNHAPSGPKGIAKAWPTELPTKRRRRPHCPSTSKARPPEFADMH
jgi:hypothetical protein